MYRLLRKIVAAILLGLIRLYQLLLSPLLGAKCRYTPTCSAYAVEAIRKWGPWKGGWLAIKRFASCRPGGGHGWDPVP
jgi:putative membrane protein insertion efficiency factor